MLKFPFIHAFTFCILLSFSNSDNGRYNSRTLMSMMFHTDSKQQWKAIETLEAYIHTDLEGLKSNLDLLLKWSTLTSVPTVGDYLIAMFSALADDSYKLHDYEAVALIPLLVKMVNSSLFCHLEGSTIYITRRFQTRGRMRPVRFAAPDFSIIDEMITLKRICFHFKCSPPSFRLVYCCRLKK